MITRRTIITILMIVLLTPVWPAHAQDEPPCAPDSGTVITRQIQSTAIGQEKSYNLYLPPDWCRLDDLPLLVMLHGLNGDHSDWVSQGHLDDTATALILAGEIDPLMILMPDGDNSFYINGPAGDYETYIVGELVNAVDEHFPTAATRNTRFIGGLSMGGYGALYLGLRHPDLFSAIGAHSPALFEPDASSPSTLLYGARGEYFQERDIVSMVERDGWPDDMRFFIDIGNADGLVMGVFRLASVMFGGQRVADYQGHIWPGAHDWRYWSTHAAEYLRFYMNAD